MKIWIGMSCIAFEALLLSATAQADPFLAPQMRIAAPSNIVPVVVFGKNSRETVDQFAVEHKLDAKDVRHAHAASGLIECGRAHGAGQLTLSDDVVTSAAHVFFDEAGNPRAKTCIFALEIDGNPVRVPIDPSTIVAGSTDPYAIAAVHDWAVARLAHPVSGVTPYGLADAPAANLPVEFVARGHIDWGEGRRLSMENCHLHDQLEVAAEGTREFSFDCETGDGASGGAVLMGADQMKIGAVLVGWRSNRPMAAMPFSRTHYNFVVSIEGAFRKAVIAAAAGHKVLVAK